MIKGKTPSGFTYEIDEHRLDDMELLELVAEADENMTLMPKVLSKLLGKKQKKRLYDFCREKMGMFLLRRRFVSWKKFFGILR